MTQQRPADHRHRQPKGWRGQDHDGRQPRGQPGRRGTPDVARDLDPQGNASSGVGVPPGTVEKTIYDALIGNAPLRDVIRPTGIPTLDLAPATQDLTAVEYELFETTQRGTHLREILRGPRRREVRLHHHRLAAITRRLDLERAGRGAPRDRAFAARILRARGHHVPDGHDRSREGVAESELTVEGIVLTMWDPRNRLAHQVADESEQTLSRVQVDHSPQRAPQRGPIARAARIAVRRR